MCNCFLGNAENFIFDPKCKPSDTPDCDWHESFFQKTYHLKMLFAKWQPFCSVFHVLPCWTDTSVITYKYNGRQWTWSQNMRPKSQLAASIPPRQSIDFYMELEQPHFFYGLHQRQSVSQISVSCLKDNRILDGHQDQHFDSFGRKETWISSLYTLYYSFL